MVTQYSLLVDIFLKLNSYFKKNFLIFYRVYSIYIFFIFINIINYLSCNFFGIIGVAISVPVGFLVKTIVDLKTASSCWKKIWKLKRIIFLKTLYFFHIILLFYINMLLSWVFLLLLSIHVIYFWILLDRDEIDVIKSFNFSKRIKTTFS